MTLTSFLTSEGITPTEFARRAGVAASTVTRILRKERAPNIRVVAKLVAASGGRLSSNDFLPLTSPEAERLSVGG